MQVLVYLAEHPGRVVSRDELEKQLWPGRVVTEDSVTNAVAKLRRAFADDAHHPRVIETVPKSGYRLIAEVTPIGGTDDRGGAAKIATGPTGPYWRPVLAWSFAAACALLAIAAAWIHLTRDDAPHPRRTLDDGKPTIAVLPFENLGATPEQDYFANGIAADLITDLSKLGGLWVIAPGSVLAYRGTEAAQQAFAELNVDYVVAGSVQRQRDRFRVNVRLIEPKDERALWGERYTGAMGDVFDIQDKVTAALVAALQLELAPGERALLATRPTASVAAYDHYLRGIEAHGRRSKAQNLTAKSHFRKAIELDPTFWRAYAGLALTHSREAIDGWTPTPNRSLDLAAQLAEKAASMDSSLPQVHFVTGQVNLFRRQHDKAIEAARRTIRVDPNYADGYALLAWTLTYAGRPTDALAALGEAMRLNPRPPASYLEILGEIRFVQGDYRQSAATFQRVLDINPGYTRARMWNAAALARAGLQDKAEWEATELLVASPEFSLSRLKFAFPFRDRRILNKLLDGLREAGLPD
jgi:TolB-like protein/Tfp pilus assembly protein PilF